MKEIELDVTGLHESDVWVIEGAVENYRTARAEFLRLMGPLVLSKSDLELIERAARELAEIREDYPGAKGPVQVEIKCVRAIS